MLIRKFKSRFCRVYKISYSMLLFLFVNLAANPAYFDSFFLHFCTLGTLGTSKWTSQSLKYICVPKRKTRQQVVEGRQQLKVEYYGLLTVKHWMDMGKDISQNLRVCNYF